MGEGKEYVSRSDELGNIHISEEVLAVIAAAAALEEQASRLTEAVAVFRIQQQQQQQRETSAVVKTVTPATPRKMAVADSGENWETF